MVHEDEKSSVAARKRLSKAFKKVDKADPEKVAAFEAEKQKFFDENPDFKDQVDVGYSSAGDKYRLTLINIIGVESWIDPSQAPRAAKKRSILPSRRARKSRGRRGRQGRDSYWQYLGVIWAPLWIKFSSAVAGESCGCPCVAAWTIPDLAVHAWPLGPFQTSVAERLRDTDVTSKITQLTSTSRRAACENENVSIV